jgi:hypothetical protein
VACTSVLVAACAHHLHTTPTTTASAGGEVTGTTATHWTAVITPVIGLTPGVQGRADISLGANGQPAAVMLVLTGLQPGQTYVWHIRHGSCSSAEPQGPASEYAALTVDPEGRGSATGTFPMVDTGLSDYHIDVHSVGAPIIACGMINAMTGK